MPFELFWKDTEKVKFRNHFIELKPYSVVQWPKVNHTFETQRSLVHIIVENFFINAVCVLWGGREICVWGGSIHIVCLNNVTYVNPHMPVIKDYMCK